MLYGKWFFDHLFILVPAQSYVGNFLATFQEFPPRQKPGSFSLDNVLDKLSEGQPK
jgi:arylsulfatase